MANVETQNGKLVNNNTSKVQPKFTDGINNLILLLFSCMVVNLIAENYVNYGIVRSPIQLTYDFFEFVQNWWWLYGIIILIYCFQTIMCFVIEKQLSLNKLSEERGIVLHGFNTLLVLNASSVLIVWFRDFSPGGGISTMGALFFLGFKFWSYVMTNRNARLQLKRKNEHKLDDGKEPSSETSTIKTANSSGEIKYPENVTFINFLKFMNTTSSVIYKINGFKSKPRELKKAFRLFFYMILIHFAVAFIVYQYAFPEADRANVFIRNRDFLPLIGVSFKLALPVMVVWLLYFYFYCFECYLVVKSCFWGTEDVTLRKDWWNAESTTIYWSKWNIQIHVALKEYVFMPVLRQGYSKRTASLVVALVSGLLHEYMITIPCRAGYGWTLFGMICQIPFAFITTYLHKNVGARWGNFVFWANLLLGETFLFMYVYYKLYGTNV